MPPTHPPVLYLLEEEMETELEAPWATIEEEVESTTGVSLLAACSETEQEHPWRHNDVEPYSPSSPALPFLPQHTTATDNGTDTSPTTTTTTRIIYNTSSSYSALLYPTGPAPLVNSFSAPRHERPRRHSSVPCYVGSSSIPPPLSRDRDGEEATAAETTRILEERKREGSENRERAEKKEETVAAPLLCISNQEQERRAATAQTTAWVELLVSKRRTMDYVNEGAELARSTYQAAWDTAGGIWRAATSKTARRTLLTTVLVGLGSAFLFGLACLGYLAFYHEYLPDQVTTVPVHLQYGYELNPYGVVSLSNVNLKDYQDYDISVTLNLPRSPANLGRGNFMLALHLLDNKPPIFMPTVTPLPVPGPQSVLEGRNILHTSTRPAIVPYTDPLVSLASRLLFLAYHVFVPTSETTKLVVPMVERLEFRPGKMSPTSMVLDVQAGQTLQVYSVFVTITAQLHGVRWFMHTYWITSFVLFTTLFWLCELFFAGVAVLFLSLIFGGGSTSSSKSPPQLKQEGETGSTQPAIKQESGEGKTLEDVPMTFPTSSRQPPLRYDPPESSVSGATPQQAEVPPGGEADDEEEEEEEDGYETRFHDSGIGTTSFSERDAPGSLRRRSSRGLGRD